MSPRPTKLSPCSRAREERAFGVVEVIIAVLLIMVVASGMVLAMTSGSKLRGSTRLQAAMTHTGQRMVEQLSSENDWMATCAKPRCAIAGEFTGDADALKLEDVEGSVQVVGPIAGVPPATESHAVPVDSDVDGIGKDDQDGVVPDHYQLLLVIRPDAGTVARYGGTADKLTRRFTTALDREGNVLNGSLRIDACVVRNQVDERMSIDGCNPSGITNVKMDSCPTNPPATGDFGGCAPAWNWVQAAALNTPHTNPSPYVALQRVPPSAYSFKIQNVSTGDPAIPSSKAKVVDGSYVFQEIEAGTYRIIGLPGSYTVGGVTHLRWKTKEIPTFHDNPAGSVGVQPGVKNHALVMFRPPRTNGGIKFFFDRLVHHYELVVETTGPEKVGGNFSFAGDKWAPTDDYLGEGAEEFCDKRMKYEPGWLMYDYSQEDGPDIYTYAKKHHNADKTTQRHRQCWIYKTAYASSNPFVNCVISAYRSSYHYFDAPYDEGGVQISEKSWKVEYSYLYCTYFRDELWHDSYYASKLPDTVLKGAVKSAVYEVSPRPTSREIKFGPGDSLAGATYPRMFCSVRGHTTHKNHKDQSTCTPGGGIDRLLPGLNTDVRTPSDASITNPNSGAAENNVANANANENVIDRPGWSTGGALWVRPTGSIVSPAGTVATPLVHVRGDGECYWRGGPYLPATGWEGKCGGCNITWKKTTTYSDTCAMLVKTCTNRFILETQTYSEGWNKVDESSGSATLVGVYGPERVPPMGGGDAKGCIRYSPEWPCATRPASVTNGNCKAPAPPPPATVTLNPTTHKVSAGTTRVPQRNVTAMPGGG